MTAYFYSLLVASILKALSIIMSVRWTYMPMEAGAFCTLQSGLKLAGNVGTATWSMVSIPRQLSREPLLMSRHASALHPLSHRSSRCTSLTCCSCLCVLLNGRYQRSLAAFGRSFWPTFSSVLPRLPTSLDPTTAAMVTVPPAGLPRSTQQLVSSSSTFRCVTVHPPRPSRC